MRITAAASPDGSAAAVSRYGLIPTWNEVGIPTISPITDITYAIARLSTPWLEQAAQEIHNLAAAIELLFKLGKNDIYAGKMP